MNTIQSIVTFTTPQMRTLRFENPVGAYPVNRYQSLVLANAAYIEAVEVSSRSTKSLCDLSAIEICCGGGPAAITLKASGLGFVGASDIQEQSIKQLHNNAVINSLAIDSLKIGSGLMPWLQPEPWVDIIACNPPCLPSALVDEQLTPSVKTAMQGGTGGTELLFDMLESLDQILTSYGRFVFIVTSMMDFNGIERFLNARFSNRWRCSPGTPVAAPYCRTSDPIAVRLLEMRDAGKAFVWNGNDGWIWRLTWAVAIVGGADEVNCDHSYLGFYPYGYAPVAQDYLHTLEIFRIPSPLNPTPQSVCL